MGAGVKVSFPGYWVETLPSKAKRHRVWRADGKKKTTIPVGPDHPEFSAHYAAARHGDPLPAPPKALDRSIDLLVGKYIAHLERMVKAGIASPLTLKQRRSQLRRMADHLDDDGDRYGVKDYDAPTSAFVAVRNAWIATPGEANNMIGSVRAMYVYAMEEGMIAHNPVAGIKKIAMKKVGATPWTADDIKAFVKRHPKGTTAYAWLALSLFTGCRRGDVILLGRSHEKTIGGATYLEFQPGKKGSAPVVLPMLPQLLDAVRALKVQGPTYLLTEHGKPFSTTASVGGRIRKWCDQAGLENRSAHGVRKALASLLSEVGVPTQAIGAILAHTNTKTTEIYTVGAQRRALADLALSEMRNFSL